MVTIDLTRFETLENGNVTDVRYGFIIKEPSMDYIEIVDRYHSQLELNLKVNEDTIRYILDAEHYTLYQEIQRQGLFRFNGRVMYV